MKEYCDAHAAELGRGTVLHASDWFVTVAAGAAIMPTH
jgi:hypothetical protein